MSDIYFKADESSGKPKLGDRLRPVIASNGVLYLKMKAIGSHNTSRREKEGKMERTGKDNNQIYRM